METHGHFPQNRRLYSLQNWKSSWTCVAMVDATKVPLADGQPSNKQWEQIKEKLKTAWHRKESATFDKVSSMFKRIACIPRPGFMTRCRVNPPSVIIKTVRLLSKAFISVSVSVPSACCIKICVVAASTQGSAAIGCVYLS